MYENEPRLLFNYPLSGCVGVMASLVLVSQVFSLMFNISFLLYLFEISLCFLFVFILSMGVRQRKLGLISTYCFWLGIYAFCMIFFLTNGIFLSTYCNNHVEKCYDKTCNYSQYNQEQCKKGTINMDSFKLKGAVLAGFILFIISVSTSLLLCAMQLRFCFLLYKFIRQEQRTRNETHVTYQRRPPNSPPQYQEAPWPEKPPGYAEAMSALYSTPTQYPIPPQYPTPTQYPTPAQTAIPAQTSEDVLSPEILAPTPVVHNQQPLQRPDPLELNMTPIDLDETPILVDSSIEQRNSITPSEVSNLSITNPFKDEIERTV